MDSRLLPSTWPGFLTIPCFSGLVFLFVVVKILPRLRKAESGTVVGFTMMLYASICAALGGMFELFMFLRPDATPSFEVAGEIQILFGLLLFAAFFFGIRSRNRALIQARGWTDNDILLRLLERNLDAEAVALARLVHERTPANPEITLNLAVALERLKQPDEARAALASLPRESLSTAHLQFLTQLETRLAAQGTKPAGRTLGCSWIVVFACFLVFLSVWHRASSMTTANWRAFVILVAAAVFGIFALKVLVRFLVPGTDAFVLNEITERLARDGRHAEVEAIRRCQST